jgi:hypothetical protein
LVSASIPVYRRNAHPGGHHGAMVAAHIDITYMNDTRDGLCKWLGTHYPSAYVIECKNYGNSGWLLKWPDFDDTVRNCARGLGDYFDDFGQACSLDYGEASDWQI